MCLLYHTMCKTLHKSFEYGMKKIVDLYIATLYIAEAYDKKSFRKIKKKKDTKDSGNNSWFKKANVQRAYRP